MVPTDPHVDVDGTTASREVTDDDLRAFLDMSTELFGVFDPAHGLVWANRSAHRVLGYDESELHGLRPDQIFIPRDPATHGHVSESRVRGKDGTVHWLEWSGARASSGGLTFGVARDVTTRHGASETLQKNQKLVRAIVENSSAAIFVKDLDERYILVNEAFVMPLNLRPEDVIGRTVAEIWGPDAGRGDDIDRAVMSSGQSVTRDDLVEHSGGSRSIMTVRFPLRDDHGAIVGMVGIATDITDRTEVERQLHEREQLLDTIVRACPDIVTMLDARGRVAEVSQASARILGYDIADPVHEELEALIHPDDLEAVYREYGQLLSLESSFLDMRYRVRHCDGHWITLETRGRAIVDEDGAPAGAVVVSRDISDDLAFEGELQAAVQSAEDASMAKSEFLSRMSHELRTPLNSVLGFAQLLDMGELDEGQREAVSHILRGGRHLLNLIDEVLDIDSIESGRLELSIGPTDIGAVVTDAADLTRPSAEDRRISLEVNAPAPGSFVRADRQRLLQVLLNLLSNAVKYSEQGDTISIEVHLTGDTTAVSVRDTGPGIDPADAERVFRPFDRLGAERSEVEGTGVGLSVSKYLIEQMTGTLALDSTVGQGSTFTITLPTSSPPSAALIDDDRVDEVGTAGSSSASVCILHIEDNSANLELVEQILARQPGIELIAAMYGSLGVELARERRPDLVLLDLNLPDMSGSAVLQHLRDDPATCDIPVVVVSADATPGQVSRLRSAGVVGYLTKPVDVAELLRVVAMVTSPSRGGAGDGGAGAT